MNPSRIRIVLATAVVFSIVLAGLASCASQPAGSSSSPASSIEVLGAEGVTSVVLDYNAGTGFEWQCTVEPEGVLGIAYEDDISASGNDEAKEPITGGPMQHVVTLRASNPGQATLACNLVRPWETDAEPAETQTFVFTVDSNLQIRFESDQSTYQHTPEPGSNS